MSDESKLTLDTIYAAWRAVGADVAGLDWAKFVGHLAAQSPAEGDADRHRLDFIQANPNLTLRYYKRHWSLAGVTSYEHRVFKTVREAIDHAMNGDKDD